jgi:dolichol-phosphate mannosyltransferase
LNEEETIGKVIDDIPQDDLRKRGYDVEVVVVDGNSNDRTIDIAKNKGARILTQTGFGKGNAVNLAFKKIDSNYVFMMDADDTYNPQTILRMLPYLESGMFDVVLGSRFLGIIEDGAMPPVNHFGNRALTSTANLLFRNGHRMSDVCTGMWGFNKNAVKGLNIDSKRFEMEVEMYAKCVKRGFRVGEVPINYKKRETFAKLKSIRDGIRIWLRLLIEKIKK